MLHAPPFDSKPVAYWTGSEKKLAYRHVKPRSVGKCNSAAVVLFLNGLLSNMNGTKCNFLQQHCEKIGAGFHCFDYRGHGESSGHFVDCTVHDWVADASDMLDHAISLGKQDDPKQQQQPNIILVGSSLGTWIALILAMNRSDSNICAVVGIGSAIDFTYNTFNDKLTYEQRAMWEGSVESNSTSNVIELCSPYLDDKFPFTKDLYKSGNEYLIMDYTGQRNQHKKLRYPVRFLHGSEDDVIHFSEIYKVAEVLKSKYGAVDVSINILPGADHRVSRLDDIAVILDTVDEFL